MVTRRLSSQNSRAELVGRIEEIPNEDHDDPSNDWSVSTLPNYDSYLRTDCSAAVEVVSRSPSISSRHDDDLDKLPTNREESNASFHQLR